MISHAVLDAQVAVELPARELMSMVSFDGGIGARLGDMIQVFLLPLLPTPTPLPFNVPFA